MKNRKFFRLVILGLMMFIILPSTAAGQADRGTALGTAFTYQGQLKSEGLPYSGTCDFQFGLYDAATMGSAVGEISLPGVTVSEGLFTVQLDFGSSVFTGESRWLEIWVRCPADTGDYQPLHPRQPLTAAPYALYALKADHALLADSVPWVGISEIPPGFADGVDNDTAYIAGDGLSLIDTTFSVNTTYLQRRITSTCIAGSYIREIAEDGTITCEPVSTNAWSLNGNSETTPGVNYLGTTDSVALVLKVNNRGALRIEPNSQCPNIIGGYSENYITSGINGATIGGGGSALYKNGVLDNWGTVSGGEKNTAGDPINSAPYATVGGGYINTASGYRSTVGGGSSNTASGEGSTVSGGSSNIASGDYSFVAGGRVNTASGYASFAAGSGAYATRPGCFVWADSNNVDVTCDFDNQFIARATGGVYFYTNSALSSGMYLPTDGSAWLTTSSRNLKENFNPVDSALLLENLSQFPISTWNYKAQDESILHVGMMADEFNSLINGLGGEGQDYINSMDAVGVALAAAQGLYVENQDLKARVDDLEARLEKLERNQNTSVPTVPLSWLMGFGLLIFGGVYAIRRRPGGGL